MRLHSPGVMTYKGSEAKTTLHEFQLPPMFTSFSYIYKPDSRGQAPFDSTSTLLERVHMKFNLDDGSFAMPMQSPFATWIIEPHEHVDLAGCKSVEMHFNITYQTSWKYTPSLRCDR
jgi:hypothetical protein